MSLNSSTIPECETALKLFWGKLSLDQKRSLGNSTALSVVVEWTSDYIMEIVQSQIAGLWIWEERQKEFEYALDVYKSLDTLWQQIIRSKLTKYFH